jgi:tetratricopeptide (TPR) repeat protein
MKKLIYTILILISCQNVAKGNIDSLKTVWNDENQNKYDRLQAGTSIIYYLFSEREEQKSHLLNLKNFSIKNNLPAGEAIALEWLAGFDNDSDSLYLKAISICEENNIYRDTNTLSNLSMMYGNIGRWREEVSQYHKALEFFYRGLKLAQNNNDTAQIVSQYLQIASVMRITKDTNSALLYLQKAYKLSLNLEKIRHVHSVSALGHFYFSQKKYQTALIKYKESLHISQSINQPEYVLSDMLSVGRTYLKLSQFDSSSYYFNIIIKSEDKPYTQSMKFSAHLGIGEIALMNNDLKKAEKYVNHARDMVLDNSSELKDLNELSYKIKKKLGDFEGALEDYETYVKWRDHTQNSEGQKEVVRLNDAHEFEKAEIIKENNKREQARIVAVGISRRNNIQYSLIFLGLLLMFGIVLSLGFIKVSNNVAEGLIFVSFLILFEFVLVFTEPYLGQYTNGEPMYNLLANSAIALLIFPIHDLLEGFLKKRIVKS